MYGPLKLLYDSNDVSLYESLDSSCPQLKYDIVEKSYYDHLDSFYEQDLDELVVLSAGVDCSEEVKDKKIYEDLSDLTYDDVFSDVTYEDDLGLDDDVMHDDYMESYDDQLSDDVYWDGDDTGDRPPRRVNTSRIEHYIDKFNKFQLREMIIELIGSDHLNLNVAIEYAEKTKNSKKDVILDWNEKFQTYLNMDEGEKKYKKLFHLAHDFVYAAQTYAKIIISESSLPEKDKTINSASLGGIAGGEKFIVQNILFKFVLDSEIRTGFWMYGGKKQNHDNAMKAASHELKGLIGYYSCGIPGLHFPLMAIIDYKGYRVISMPILPINRTTIQYGSSDAGKTIHKDISEINKKMKKAARKLNLKSHVVGNSQTYLDSAGDLECHKGHDQRYYVLDFARTFPPECPDLEADKRIPRQEYFYMLRPEFVRNWDNPLCPDAFTNWQINDPYNQENNLDVYKATNYLHNKIVFDFSKKLEELAGDTKSSKFNVTLSKIEKQLAIISQKNGSDLKFETATQFKNFDLTEELHRVGLNLRLMGRVRANCNSGTGKSLLLGEMIARVVKDKIKKEMRRVMKKRRMLSEEPFNRVVIKYVNFISSPNKLEGKEFWNFIRDKLAKKFRYSLTNDEMMSDGVLLRELIFTDKVIETICSLVGIQLTPDAYQELITHPENFEIIDSDILEITPRVKHMNVIEFSEGMALYTLAQRLGGKEKIRVLEIAASKFRTSLKSSGNTALYWHQLGLVILEQSTTTNSTPKIISMLYDASSKFKVAIEIDPTFSAAITEHCICLLKLASLENIEMKRNSFIQTAEVEIAQLIDMSYGEHLVQVISTFLSFMRKIYQKVPEMLKCIINLCELFHTHITIYQTSLFNPPKSLSASSNDSFFRKESIPPEDEKEMHGAYDESSDSGIYLEQNAVEMLQTTVKKKLKTDKNFHSGAVSTRDYYELLSNLIEIYSSSLFELGCVLNKYEYFKQSANLYYQLDDEYKNQWSMLLISQISHFESKTETRFVNLTLYEYYSVLYMLRKDQEYLVSCTDHLFNFLKHTLYDDTYDYYCKELVDIYLLLLEKDDKILEDTLLNCINNTNLLFHWIQMSIISSEISELLKSTISNSELSFSFHNLPISPDFINILCQYDNLTELNLSKCYLLDNDSLSTICDSDIGIQKLSVRSCKKISDTGIDSVTQNCPRITEIHVSGCPGITDVGVEKIIQNLIVIKTLNVASTKVSNEIFSHFKNSTSCDTLEILSLKRCKKISDFGFFQLSGWPGLKSVKSLNLNGCFLLSPKGIHFITNNFKSLKDINLSALYHMDDTCIMGIINQIPSLEGLSVWKCTSLTRESLRNIFQLSNLKKLVIDSHNLDLDPLQHAEFFTNITELDVSNNNDLFSSDLWQIFHFAKTLKKFRCNSTHFTERTLLILSDTIESLTLTGVSLDDEAKKYFKRFVNLKELTLRNMVKNTGICAPDIFNLKSLTYLDISDNRLISKGFLNTIFLELSQLEIIDLSGIPMDGCCLHSISRLKYLRSLNIARTKTENEFFKYFFSYSIVSIDISNCSNITPESVLRFLQYSPKISTLKMNNMESFHSTPKLFKYLTSNLYRLRLLEIHKIPIDENFFSHISNYPHLKCKIAVEGFYANRINMHAISQEKILQIRESIMTLEDNLNETHTGYEPNLITEQVSNVKLKSVLPTKEKYYSYELVTSRPHFLNSSKLETYLSNEEFEEIFQMTKTEFSKKPIWIQNDIKSKLNLYQ